MLTGRLTDYYMHIPWHVTVELPYLGATVAALQRVEPNQIEWILGWSNLTRGERRLVRRQVVYELEAHADQFELGHAADVGPAAPVPHTADLTAEPESADDREQRPGEQQLRVIGWLLPGAVRERQVLEWMDHVATAAADPAGDPDRVLRSIMVRAAVPVAVRARQRQLRRASARAR